MAVKDTARRLFHRFDSHRAEWDAAATAIATLDCLLSLARWSSQGDGGTMSRPQVEATSSGAEPYLHVREGRHPCMVTSVLAADGGGGGGGVIPNSLHLGGTAGGRSYASCILLTGPNMGGKSTYLRQACLMTILTQMVRDQPPCAATPAPTCVTCACVQGCYVPAESLRMTPVDRIFTRVGASDRILAGQSTFYVELAETATILNQATRNSLVILDELGALRSPSQRQLAQPASPRSLSHSCRRPWDFYL